MNTNNLKLIAKTNDDLRVISAHLQDSIVKTSDIASLARNRIFLTKDVILNQGLIQITVAITNKNVAK